MLGRTLALCLAATGIAFLAGLPQPASAGPGVVAKPEASPLVQEAGYYKRRWRYRDTHVRATLTAVDDVDGDTWVRAPFARVYSGTWVRAPFVNLWIPR